MKWLITIALLCGIVDIAFARRITVAQNGKADFTSIQEAINSVSADNKTQIDIFIADGVYKEKIFINKSHIRFIGQSRTKTIIQQSIARDVWRCNNPSDWGVATINVDSCSDLSFENLTIANLYGWENPQSITIPCANDSTGVKQVNANGHQMAFRSFYATRLRFINCHFRAFGGDTMSPWNVAEGQFYFKDCTMEGGVDLFCPRGWSYAENCVFIVHNGTAAIWHDGTGNKDAKTVLVNCRFEGYDGFRLGRFHRDAQFYLINCRFASNMADMDIYQVPTNNLVQWGKRVYYAGCSSLGKQYNWYRDNLSLAVPAVTKDAISPQWVFGKTWNPVN
jgi:pectinesterase